MKECFKCNKRKHLTDFYSHKQMSDGRLNKCKDCTKSDARQSARNISKACEVCMTTFGTCKSEITRGGGKYCSRKCYYASQPETLERKWRGRRSYMALHKWVQRHRGKPNECEFCGKVEGKFEWSNKSGEYKEDLTDWQRLCIKCHRNYDDVGNKAWVTRRLNQAKN